MASSVGVLKGLVFRKFALKDLGLLNFFLGIQVTYVPSGLHLSQSKYIHDMLMKLKLEHINPCASPSIVGKSLSLHDGTLLSDSLLYRSMVGALQYLTNTRPNIAYIVNKLSQFLKAPIDVHWVAVKCVLQYLKGTSDYGLLIPPSTSLSLTEFSDADWAASIDDRKSVAAHCVFLSSSLIFWSSKKQTAVARPSTESKYRALAQASTDITWIRNLLHEIGFRLQGTPII